MDGLRSALDELVVDVPPLGDLDRAIAQVRDDRRRTGMVAAAAVIVLAIVVTATAVVARRDASAPEPADPVGPQQLGGPPLTPYSHDGVLYVGGVEIEIPWRRSPTIEVVGDTVLVGGYGQRGVDPGWSLVDGDRLEPVPVPDMYPHLSRDGRIVYWWTNPTADSTRVVMWDAETNRQLASRDLPGDDVDGRPRGYLAGIDGDGMAYWVDEGSEIPVTRWDVRADTVQSMPDLTTSDMPYPSGTTGEFFRDQFVSPDGTKEVFSGGAPGDPDTIMPCCATELRVRPVGSEDPSDLVSLRVPENVSQPLYDYQTHQGNLGVWWETNETVLAMVHLKAGQTVLVRCSVTDGACARVFDLDPNDSGFIDWSFAHFPTTG